ncbi:hypothetical protein AWH69_10670 [Janibacter melonis]|uniref:Uncharacterized protein n=1 Tax=Janibacter melonis TaxID=262209 RepID=A0A176QB10_9MICO|nr:hypothetical protein AWH69_10670 [Janibacter melonis]
MLGGCWCGQGLDGGLEGGGALGVEDEPVLVQPVVDDGPGQCPPASEPVVLGVELAGDAVPREQLGVHGSHTCRSVQAAHLDHRGQDGVAGAVDQARLDAGDLGDDGAGDGQGQDAVLDGVAQQGVDGSGQVEHGLGDGAAPSLAGARGVLADPGR